MVVTNWMGQSPPPPPVGRSPKERRRWVSRGGWCGGMWGEVSIVVAPLGANPRVGQSPLGGVGAQTATAERCPGGSAVVRRGVTGV
jgi:hypothetical protein